MDLQQTLNNGNNIPSYYLIDKTELEKKNITQETKTTSTKNNEESHEPELYTSNDILSIFNKESNKGIFRENLKNLKFSEYIEDDLHRMIWSSKGNAPAQDYRPHYCYNMMARSKACI